MIRNIDNGVRWYEILLIALVVAYVWLHANEIAAIFRGKDWHAVPLIICLYLVSHVFRMARLAVLSLDERRKIPALVGAHTLTAFPGNVLPFKLGEVLRLGSFFVVYDFRGKALAVWLTERFCDVLVITMFMIGLYFLNVSVPDSVRLIFLLFASVSILGLAGIFAMSRIFLYLNRHLVLASTTKRGLKILRASYRLRELEAQVKTSIEGRLSGILLLTVFIWAMEIVALCYFLAIFSSAGSDWRHLLTNGLLGSLPGGDFFFSEFGVYRVVALAILTVLSMTTIQVIKQLYGNKA